MSISVRCYLFASDGLQRISQRVMNGLCHGQDALPQYAGTKQRIATAIYELEKGKAARVVRVEGSYLDFDKAGKIQESLARGAFEAIQTYRDLENSKGNTHSSKVFDLAPKLNREKWERENRWTPNQGELDLIVDDLFGRKAAAPLKTAKGITEKPVPLTYEAKEAIEQIRLQLYTLAGKMELLSEQALKGFAFEARRLSADDLEPLWQGFANAADRRREILARYRTGKGVWYASVDIVQWDSLRKSGHTTSYVHERCNSKKEAETAARRLLAENAKYFSAETTIEASVVCDLEWHEEDRN